MALVGGGGQGRRLSWGGVSTFDSLQGVSHSYIHRYNR